jgi:hypothetical protein
MMQCHYCGNQNHDNVRFCTACGQPFAAKETVGPELFSAAPRPYAWKTDEYQTQSEPRVSHTSLPHQAPAPFNTGPHPSAYYRCPNCGTSALPIIQRRVSTAGWIVFSLLLVFTFIFFWIGLLMKEDVRICPACRATLR